jgi:hypothetical protein
MRTGPGCCPERLGGSRGRFEAKAAPHAVASLERTIAMEILEQRQLLAITPQLVGSTATFTGNSAADTLHLRAVLGVLQWSLDGITWTADLNTATAPVESLNISGANSRIQVNLGDGADRLLVQSTLQTTMNVLDTFEYDGGAGVDELVGPNLANLWRMTGPAAGSINALLPFKNTERFVGGTASDEFAFDPGINFPNFISGREGLLTLRSDTQLSLASTAVVTTRIFALGGDPRTAASTAPSGEMVLRSPAIIAANNAALLAFGNSGFLGGDITLDATATQSVNWTLGLAAFQTLNAQARIQLGAVTILGQNILATASATTTKTASLSVNLASNTVDALGQSVTLAQLNSFNTFAASVIATSAADILVGSGATLKAANAILLNANASSTAFITTLGRYLGVTYASSSPTASVVVAGGTSATTIDAGGAFAMDAVTNNAMNVQAFVPSIGDAANISVAYGKASSKSQSWLQSGATVNARSARVQALNNNDFNTVAVAVGYQLSGAAGFGATVAIGDYDSEATARVDGVIKSEGTVTVSGRSNNIRNQTRGFGTVSTQVTTSPLVQAVDTYLKSLPISALIGGRLIDPAPGLFLGLSASVVIADSDSRAFGVVGVGASIQGGSILVEGRSEDTFQSSASSSAGDASLVALGGSVLISNVNNQADANVGKGATLDTAGSVDVLANATQRQRLNPPVITLDLGAVPVAPETFPEENKLKYGTQVVAKNVRDALAPLAPYLSSLLTGQAPQVTTYVHTGNAVQANGALVVGGTVNLFNARNVARAWVDPEAKIGAAVVPKQVTVRADSLIQTSNVSGVSSTALSRVEPNRAAVTIGGSLQMISYDTAAEAWVDDNTVIKSSGGVTVEANSNDSLISLTRGGQNAVDVAVNGTVVIHRVKNRAAAHLEESAAVTTGNLQVLANQSAFVLAAAGVVGVEGGVSVGIAAAYNDLDSSANAFLGHANATVAVPATITAGSVFINSSSDVDLWALTVAGGALGDVEKGTGGETEVDDAGQIVPVGSGGRNFGFGLSADVGLNFVRNESRAFVRGKLKIVASGLFGVLATSDVQLVSAAGAVANATYSGLGGAYGHNELAELVHAFVEGAQVQASGARVQTQGTQRIVTFSAGGSSAKENASVAGSVNMNRINVDNRAYLDAGTVVVAPQEVSILATQGGKVISVAGALALDRFVAVGASVDLGFIQFNTLAEIAKDVTVQSDSIELRTNVANDVCSFSASLSASVLLGVGAAGSASYLQVSDVSAARVGENSVLNGKRSIWIKSQQASNSTVVVGAQGVGLVGVGAAVGITDIKATSTVFVAPRAQLLAEATLRLQAEALNNSTVVTFVPTVASLGGGALAFSYGKAASHADSQTSPLSVLKAGTVEIAARNETQYTTLAIAAGYQLARAGVAGVGVAVAFSDHDTSARALANGTIDAAGNVLVQANAINRDHQTRALGSVVNQADSVPNLAAVQQIEDTLAGLSFANEVAGRTMNAAGSGSVDVAVAAAVAIGFSDNAAFAAIGPGAQVSSPGLVDVVANAEDGFRASATGTAGEAGKAAVGGAVSVQLRTNKADALVDNGAIVDAGKLLNVRSSALVPPPVAIPVPTINLADVDTATGTDRVEEEYADGVATVAKIGTALSLLAPLVQSLLASSDPLVTTFVHSAGTVATGGVVSIAFGVNWLDIDNFADAHIGPNARINTIGPPGSVAVAANGSVSTIDLAGQASSLNYGGAKGGTVGFGGSFVGVNYDNRATAHIDDGTIVKAGDLQVLATTYHAMLTVVQAGAQAETAAIQGAVSFAELSNTTTAYIDDEAQVTSDSRVDVSANHESLIINVAGGIAIGGNAGVGVSAAFNDIKNTTRAFIGDSNASTGPLGFVTAKLRIGVNAKSRGQVWNSSFSGASGAVNNWGSGGELEYNGLEFGFGLSGDTAIDSMTSIVEAFIRDAGTITVLAASPLLPPGVIDVEATQDDLIVASSGAVAVTAHVGIGGAFVWLPVTRRTHAFTQNTTLASDTLRVRANASEQMAMATAGGSGARRVAALAGSANLLQVQNDTQAYLGNQTTAQIRGAVEVLADQRTDSVSTAGAVASAQQGFLAIGAALDRPEITQNVQAYTASTATLAAEGNVSIHAGTDENVRSIAASTAKAAAAGEPNRTYLNNGVAASPFNGVTPQNVSLDTLYTSSSALGDLDGDGDLDLVIGTLEGFNRRYLNDGTGKFGTGLEVGADLLLGILDGKIPDQNQVLNSQTPDPTTSVALLDANADGRLDLLAGNLGLPSRLYLNYGDGRFLPGKDVTESGRSTMSVAVGDVNKDGFLDFVTGNAGSTNRLYLGQADGTYAAGVDIAGDVLTTQSIVLGDVTGDGWLDVIVGNLASPNRLYRNNGAGGFLPGVDLAGSGNGTTSLALGDIDGDGDLDLVAGHMASPPKFHRNNGGTFAAGVNVSPDLRVTQKVVLADMNADGRLDVVTANLGSTNRLYRGTGGGAFAAGQNIGVQDDYTRTISAGDLNGDARPDLVAGNLLPGIGIAGSLAAPQFRTNTRAFVQANGTLTTPRNLLVDSQDRLRLVALAGASAGGTTLGVGLSLANPDLVRTNQAFLGDNSRVTALGQGTPMSDPRDPKQTFRGMLINADTYDDLLNYAAGNAEAQDAAVKASAVYTDAQAQTDAYIGVGAIVNGNNAGASELQSVLLDASHESYLLSIAGSVTRSKLVAIGAAGDLSELDNRVSAYIGNGAQVQARNHVLASATSNGAIISITRGASVAETAAIAGSVSLVVPDIQTRAYIDSNAVVNADGNILLLAKSMADYATFAGTKAQDGTIGIGASHSAVLKSDVTESYVASAARVHARALRDASNMPTGEVDANGQWVTKPLRGVGVIAVSGERIQPTSVSGQQSSVVGLAGSINLVVLDENTRAEVETGAVVNPVAANAGAGAGQTVYVLAVDNTQLFGLAGARTEALLVGVSPGADVSNITKSTQAILGGTVEAKSDIYVQAFAHDRVSSVPAALSTSIVTSIAGAGSLSLWNVTTEAFTRSSAIVHTPGSILVWADGGSQLDAMAGGGNTSLLASAGASIGASIYNKVTRAYIGANGTVTAEGKLEQISVPNGEFVVTFASQPDALLEVDVPSAIGVIRDVIAFVFDNPIRDVIDPFATPAPDDDLSLKQQRTATPRKISWQGLAVTATSQDDAEILAAGYAASVGGSAQGSGAAVVFSNNTVAFVDSGALVNNNPTLAGVNQGVLVAAGSDASYLGIAGVAAASALATVGAGASTVMVDNTTQAYIGSMADVRAKRLVQVAAYATEDVLAIGAAANVSGLAGVAGSLAVVSLDTQTYAFIDDNAVVVSAGNVFVSASDNTDSDVLSGGAILGLLANVGASLGVTLIEKDTQAFIDAGARVDAYANATESITVADGMPESVLAGNKSTVIKGLVVQAVSVENVTSIVGGGSVSLGLSIAGAGVATVLDSNTVAFIGTNAKINESTPTAGSDQSVHVGALNKSRVFSVSVNILGGSVGLAGGIDLGILRNDTNAYIGTGAIVNAKKDVLVLANGSRDVDSFVGGAGLTAGIGIQGSVALYSLGATLDDDSKDLLLGFSGADSFQNFVDNSISTLLNSGANGIASILAQYTGFLDTDTQAAAGTIGSRTPSGAVTAAVNSAAPYQGTTASVDGAVINAGRDVIVRALDTTDAVADTSFTFAFGIGGGFAVNIDIGRINSNGHAEAFVDSNARIRAGRDARVLAQQADKQEVVATVAFNNMEDTVRAYTDSADIEAGQSIVVDATSSTTAEYSSLMPGFSTLRVRVAINEIDNRISAFARNGSRLKALAGDVQIKANESSQLLAKVVSATVPVIFGESLGIGGASALNNIHNKTLAYVEDSVVAAPAGAIDIAATSTPTITAIAVGGSGAQTVAAGGSVSINEIGGGVEAFVRANADVQAFGAVQVRATNVSNLMAITGGAAGAETVAIGASVSKNLITDQVKAWVEASQVKSTTDSVSVAAKTTPNIDALAIGGAGAATFALGGSVTLNEIDDVVDAHISAAAIVTAPLAVRVTASEDKGRIRALAGGAAGAGTAGVGAAVSTNDIGTRVTGWIEAATVTALGPRGLVLVSASSSSSMETATIGGAGAGTFAAGGSVSLNDMHNTVDARIAAGATVTGQTSVAVQGSDGSTIAALAGSVAGAGVVAVGASVATNDITTVVRGRIENATVSGSGNTIDVRAATSSSISSITAGGTGAGTFAAGGSVSLNDIQNSLDAHINGAAQINDQGTVRVQADDTSKIQSLAGTVTGAGVVSIGAAVATNDIQTIATAFVETATVVAGSLEVLSTSASSIKTLSAGLSGAGTVSITGAISLNKIRNTLDAHIQGAATVTVSEKAQVSASNTSTIESLSGQAGGAGAVGIGGAAAYNEISGTTRSYVENATVTASNGNVLVTALGRPTIFTIAAGGNGGIVGISGSVAINLIESRVESRIRQATVTAFGSVLVQADSGDTIESYGGSLGAGVVGLGGSVITNTFDNQTKAFVDASTIVARGLATGYKTKTWNATTGVEISDELRGLGVIADSRETLNTISVSLGAGFVGVSANVTVNNFHDVTEAYIDNSRVNTSAQPGGEVLVRAHQLSDVQTGGGAIGGGVVGVGAVVNTTLVENQTRAFITDSDGLDRTRVFAGLGAEVNAFSQEEVDTVVVGAGAGLVGAAGSVTTTTFDVNTEAFIGPAILRVTGDLDVLARDLSSMDLFAGTVGAGGVGLGASVVVNDITSIVRAYLSESETNASARTRVLADSSESIDSAAATGGLGVVGVGGSIIVSSIATQTRAFTAALKSQLLVNQDSLFGGAAQDVIIRANDTAVIDDDAGAVAGGLVGVGASVNVATIKNVVDAQAGASSQIAAKRLIDITADSNRTVHSLAVTFGAGLVGIQGSVAVATIGSGLDAQGAAQVNSIQGVVNPAINLGGGVPNVNASDPVAARARSKTATTRYSITDNLSTGAAFGDTSAHVDANAVLLAGDDVRVVADADSRLDMIVPGVALGYVGVGGSVGIGTIDSQADARVAGGARIRAADDVEIVAGGHVNNSKINAFAGSAGVVGLGAAVALFDSTNNATATVLSGARIEQAADLTVAADSSSTMEAEGNATSLGAGAVGVAVAEATENGTVEASLADGALVGDALPAAPNVGNLVVKAGADHDVTAHSMAAAAGIVGVGTNVSDALVDPAIRAFVGDVDLFLTGNLDVTASSAANVTADTDGLSGGLGAAGVSVANATLTPEVDAYIQSGANVNAGGNVSIRALHNFDTAGALLRNPDLTVRGAYAEADAAGGGLIDGKGAVPTATNRPDIDSYIGTSAVVRAGQVTAIESRSAHVAAADAYALSIGIGLSVGASLPTADGNGVVRARLDGTVTGGTDLRLTSQSHGDAKAMGEASGGGLINATIPIVEAQVSPTVEAMIKSTATVDVTRDVTVDTISQGEATAKALGLSVGGLAVGTMRSQAEVSPQVSGYIGNTTVKAGRHVAVTVRHNATLTGPSASNDAEATAETTRGGLVAGQGASPTATASADVRAYLASGGTIDAAGDVSFIARSGNSAISDANALTIGLVAVGASQADATANGVTKAYVDGKIARGVNLSIQADSLDHADTTADASGGGLVAVNVPRSNSTVHSVTQALLGNGSNVADAKVSGSVEILADATAYADSLGLGFTSSVIGVGQMKATTDVRPDVLSRVATQSKVDAGQNLTVRSLLNYSTPTTVDSGRKTKANARATSGFSFVVDIESARSTARLVPSVLAEVRPSSAIKVGNDASIVARSYHEVESDSRGDGFGLVGVGTTHGISEAAGSVRSLVSDPASFVVGRNLAMETEQSGSVLATSDAAAGGFFAGRQSISFADAHPLVETALNGGPTPLQVGGNATMRASANFDATANASGDSGGVGSFGESSATAKWRPDIRAYLDSNSDLQAGGDVAIQAYNNHESDGTLIAARRVRAYATSSVGGLVGATGADAEAIVNAETEARVRPFANITARNIDILAKSRNNADVDGSGNAYGVAALGSVIATAQFSNEVLAGLQAGISENRTALDAAEDVQIRAYSNNLMDVDAIGGAGGLLAAGAAEANAWLLVNRTEAAVGNNSRIDAGSDLSIIAENRTNLDANASEVMAGGVIDNETQAFVRIVDSQTTADVGTGVKINVNTILMYARDIDIDAIATSNASAPFALGGSNTARSIVESSSQALTHVGGGGTDIVACKKATFWAFADQVTTITRAYTSTTGVTGNLVSIADNTKDVDADVIADAGSKITTEQLIVDSGVPVANAVDYERTADTDANTVVQVVSVVVDTVCTVIGEVITLWGLLGDAEEVCEDIVETFEEILGADVDEIKLGSQTLNNSIDFNSQVVIKPCVKVNPLVIVNSAGIIEAAAGALLFDLDRQLKVGDQVTGGQITVGPIRNDALSSIHISARGGTLKGAPVISFDAGFDSIQVSNASGKDLVLSDIETFNRSLPKSALYVAAGNAREFRYQLAATGVDTRIDVASTGTGQVILRGMIANPGGTTRILANRNIVADGSLAEINTRLLEVASTAGSVGRAGQPLPLLFPATDPAKMGNALAASGITSARGSSGIFLKVAGRSIEGRPANLRIDQIVSPAGPVDIQIVNSEELLLDKTFKPLIRTIGSRTLVDNVSVGTPQSSQSLAIRTPQSVLRNDVRLGTNVAVSGQLAVRGDLQVDLGASATMRVGSVNLGEGSRLDLIASSGFGQRGETSRVVIGPGQRSGQFASLPEVGSEIGFGVFVSQFAGSNSPVRYGADGRVEVALYQAGPGDANGDRAFDSGDLVRVFSSGRYETGLRGAWGDGDWDGNGFFDTSDLIAAFMTGDYERPSAGAVPATDPSAAALGMDYADSAVSQPAADLLLSAWQAAAAVPGDLDTNDRSQRWLPAWEFVWAEVGAAVQAPSASCGCEDRGEESRE